MGDHKNWQAGPGCWRTVPSRSNLFCPSHPYISWNIKRDPYSSVDGGPKEIVDSVPQAIWIRPVWIKVASVEQALVDNARFLGADRQSTVLLYGYIDRRMLRRSSNAEERNQRENQTRRTENVLCHHISSLNHLGLQERLAAMHGINRERSKEVLTQETCFWP